MAEDFSDTDERVVIHQVDPSTLSTVRDILNDAVDRLLGGLPEATNITDQIPPTPKQKPGPEEPKQEPTPIQEYAPPQQVNVKIESRYLRPTLIAVACLFATWAGYRAADSVSIYQTPEIPATAEASPILSEEALHPADYSEQEAPAKSRLSQSRLIPVGCAKQVCTTLLGGRLIYYANGQNAKSASGLVEGIEGGCPALKKAAVDTIESKDLLPKNTSLDSLSLTAANSSSLNSPKGAQSC